MPDRDARDDHLQDVIWWRARSYFLHNLINRAQPLCCRIVSDYFSFIWSWNCKRNFQLQMTKNNYIYDEIFLCKMLFLD